MKKLEFCSDIAALENISMIILEIITTCSFTNEKNPVNYLMPVCSVIYQTDNIQILMTVIKKNDVLF